MDKKETIYELIHTIIELSNFDRIIKYLDKTFENIKDETETDAYSVGIEKVYLLNSQLLICCNYFKDIFGSSWTDISTIGVEKINNKDSYVRLYFDSATDGDSKRSYRLLEENSKVTAIKLYRETLGMKNTVEELTHIVKASYDTEIINYWKSLIIDEPGLKNNIEVLRLVLPSMYTIAATYRDELMEYERISPYGGEDVEVPESNGIVFIHNLESKYNIDLNNKKIYTIALQILLEKNPNDEYIKNIKTNYSNAKKIVTAITVNKNKIYEYMELSLRYSYIMDTKWRSEDKLDILNQEIEKLYGTLLEKASELEKLENKKYSIFEKIFKNKRLIENNNKICEIKNLIIKIESHINLRKAEKSIIEKQIEFLRSEQTSIKYNQELISNKYRYNSNISTEEYLDFIKNGILEEKLNAKIDTMFNNSCNFIKKNKYKTESLEEL